MYFKLFRALRYHNWSGGLLHKRYLDNVKSSSHFTVRNIGVVSCLSLEFKEGGTGNLCVLEKSRMAAHRTKCGRYVHTPPFPTTPPTPEPRPPACISHPRCSRDACTNQPIPPSPNHGRGTDLCTPPQTPHPHPGTTAEMVKKVKGVFFCFFYQSAPEFK